MSVNYAVPLWSIILFLVPLIGLLVWTFIKMIFKQDSHSSRISDLETKSISHEANIDTVKKEHDSAIATLKKDIELKLDKHKAASDSRLMEINNIMIETKTMVTLLVGDKIKK